jgi:Ca2+-binding RTX toxin-like protein
VPAQRGAPDECDTDADDRTGDADVIRGGDGDDVLPRAGAATTSCSATPAWTRSPGTPATTRSTRARATTRSTAAPAWTRSTPGAGDDWIATARVRRHQGGPGKDLIATESGNDDIDGGSGHDEINSGRGKDG